MEALKLCMRSEETPGKEHDIPGTLGLAGGANVGGIAQLWGGGGVVREPRGRVVGHRQSASAHKQRSVRW